MALNDSEGNPFKCPICWQWYEEEGRVPMSLPCGHSLCSQCLESISSLSEGSHRCPADRKPFLIDHGPARNYALLHVMSSSALPLHHLLANWKALPDDDDDVCSCEHLLLPPGSVKDLRSLTGNVEFKDAAPFHMFSGALGKRKVAVTVLAVLTSSSVTKRPRSNRVDVDPVVRHMASLALQVGLGCQHVCDVHGLTLQQGRLCVVTRCYPRTLADLLTAPRKQEQGQARASCEAAAVVASVGSPSSALPVRPLALAPALRLGADLCRCLLELHRLGVAACLLEPYSVVVDEGGRAVLAGVAAAQRFGEGGWGDGSDGSDGGDGGDEGCDDDDGGRHDQQQEEEQEDRSGQQDGGNHQQQQGQQPAAAAAAAAAATAGSPRCLRLLQKVEEEAPGLGVAAFLGAFCAPELRGGPAAPGPHHHHQSEEREGQGPSAQSDVWSLACLLVYALTGGLPAGGTAGAQAGQSAPPLLPAWLPPGLSQLLLRCLSPDPGQRPTVEHLLAQLSELEQAPATAAAAAAAAAAPTAVGVAYGTPAPSPAPREAMRQACAAAAAGRAKASNTPEALQPQLQVLQPQALQGLRQVPLPAPPSQVLQLLQHAMLSMPRRPPSIASQARPPAALAPQQQQHQHQHDQARQTSHGAAAAAAVDTVAQPLPQQQQQQQQQDHRLGPGPNAAAPSRQSHQHAGIASTSTGPFATAAHHHRHRQQEAGGTSAAGASDNHDHQHGPPAWAPPTATATARPEASPPVPPWMPQPHTPELEDALRRQLRLPPGADVSGNLVVFDCWSDDFHEMMAQRMRSRNH